MMFTRPGTCTIFWGACSNFLKKLSFNSATLELPGSGWIDNMVCFDCWERRWFCPPILCNFTNFLSNSPVDMFFLFWHVYGLLQRYQMMMTVSCKKKASIKVDFTIFFYSLSIYTRYHITISDLIILWCGKCNLMKKNIHINLGTIYTYINHNQLTTWFEVCCQRHPILCT